MSKKTLITCLYTIIAISCGHSDPQYQRRPIAAGAGQNTESQQSQQKGQPSTTDQKTDDAQAQTEKPSSPSTTEQPKTSDTTVPQTSPSSTSKTPVHFSIMLEQTVAGCAQECGILFDAMGDQNKLAKLTIKYTHAGKTSEMSFQHGLNGMKNAFTIDIREKKQNIMLVKKPAAVGLFYTDISEIPVGATIESALLYLTLHKHEGISNSDKTSVMAVYENLKPWSYGGDFLNPQKGTLIREIRAKEDMWDKGIQKWANPTGAYDFTAYAKKIQQQRK